MGSANKNYPISVQAKLPITSSEKASRPFKPPSSVLTSRSSANGGSSVEQDEKEEDIMGMYASKGSDHMQKGGKKGLLGLYHSENGSALNGEELQSSQKGNVEPRIMSR